MEFLLDSVILIDHFNGYQQATQFILKHQQHTHISVISRAEVLTGFRGVALARAKQLLDLFPLLSMDKEIADLAAQLRQTVGWKLPDAIQAAIAKSHGLKLVTRNSKDFSPKKHKFVLIPYNIQ